MRKMGGREDDKSLGENILTSSRQAVLGANAFRPLRDSEGDLKALQARLDQVRHEARLGHPEAMNHLEDLITHLRQMTTDTSRQIGVRVLGAEALSLYGSILQTRAESDKARETLEQAVSYFERIVESAATFDGQFYGDYGTALALLGRKDEARKVLTHAYQTDSKLHKIPQILGLLLKEHGEFAESEPLLEEAVNQEPTNAPLHTNLAEVLEKTGKVEKAAKAYCEAGYLFGQTGEFNTALERFRDSLRLDPKNTDVLFACGDAARLVGQPEEAVRYYKTALTQDPDRALGWLNMSFALLQLNQNKEAISAADHAYQLDSSQKAAVAIVRSQALESLGHLKEAEDCLEQALVSMPGNLPLLYAKADLLLRQGRLEHFLPALDRALVDDVPSTGIRILRGRTLRLLGRFPEAITVLRQATDADPDASEGSLELTLALSDADKKDAALKEIEMLLSREPTLRVAWLIKSEVLESQGRWSAALEALERGMETEGPNSDQMAFKGHLLARLERFSEAVTILDKVVREEPSRDREWIELIDAQRTLGKTADAMRSVTRALELRPEWPPYVALHGLILADRGITDQAIAEIRRAVEQDPKLLWARQELINLLLAKARFREALQEAEEGLEFESHDPALLVKKSEALRALGRVPEALAEANAVLLKNPDHAAGLAQKAQALWSLDKNQAALEAISRALEKQPNQAYWWGVKGGVLRDLQRDAEALVALERASHLLPDYSFALLNRAAILRGKGETDQALALLEDILKRDPDNREALLEKAFCLMSSDLDQAVTVLEMLVKQAPDFPEALLQLGDAYRLRGQYDEALQQLDEALRLNPEFWSALGTKGQVLIAQGKWQDGVTLLQKSLQGSPTLEWVLPDLGHGLRILGQSKEALEAFDRALAFDPKNESVLSNKAWVLMEMDRAQESVEVLKYLIELNPKVGYPHAQLGAALQQLEKLEEAQQAISRALELEPEDGLALGVQSGILANLGLFSEAIPYATKAATILNEAWAFNALGWAYENDGFGCGKEALNAYQAAIELDPNDLWNVKGKGNALRLIGRKLEAREAYQQVIDSARARTAESGAYTVSLLGWCHHNLGEYDEAIRLYLTPATTKASISPEQYDLALSLLCAGRCTLALETYRKVTEGLRSEYKGKQRGIIHVALFDLYDELSDPDVTNADSALTEVAEGFHLLLQRFHELGGTDKISLPAAKGARSSDAKLLSKEA